MKTIYNILLFLILLLPSSLIASNYFVDPSSISTIKNGSFSNPWTSIAQVNTGTLNIQPGDSIFFKKNQSYFGRLNVNNSGTITNPIVYTTYGQGQPPIFTYSTSNVITMYNKQYVVIDGFTIIDSTMDLNDHSILAKISYGIVVDNSPNNIIRNCEITLVGIGIEITKGSNNTLVENNYIHNLRMVRNTPITINSDDDFGASTMVISSTKNKIIGNRLEEAWAYSYDYVFDGGAIDFFGTDMSDNIIMFNSIKDCNDLLEIGSDRGGIANNILVAYNKIINCGRFGVFHNMYNNWSLQINNIQYYNNVFVELKKQFTKPNIMVWASGIDQSNLAVLKNNIFWLSSGIDFANNRYDNGVLQHENNIYRISNGLLGITLNKNGTEYSSKNLNIFTDTIGDPYNWNYNLRPESIAINFGTNVGLDKDFARNDIIDLPDAGILEYLGIPSTTLKATSYFLPITCFGGVTNVTINAIGGKPPYIGTGVFPINAGFHSFAIADQGGNYDTVSLFISEPSKLNINIQYDTIKVYGSKTTATIIASGGIPSYTYNLNSGIYQSSNIFKNILAGDNIFNVKDSNGCISTLNTTIVYLPLSIYPNNLILAHIYPNPSISQFTLYTDKIYRQIFPTTIKIYNTTSGALIYTIKSNTNKTETFGANFPPANYILQIEIEGKSQLIQFLKF